jgi:hypothetical protein
MLGRILSVLTICVIVLFCSCSNDRKEKAESSSNAKKGIDSLIEQQIKISECITCIVKEARIVTFEGTDTAFERRWTSVAGLLDSAYSDWKVRGSFRRGFSINPIKKSQFINMILVFNNEGSVKETISLCSKDKRCPRISLVDPSGTTLPIWESIIAGMYRNSADLKVDMEAHGPGVVRRISEYTGDLYVDLSPKQRTWVALLFERKNNTKEFSLQVLDKALPISVSGVD